MTQPPSSDHASGAFLPHGWDTLAPLLDVVLDAAPEARAGVLDAVSKGDPALRAALAQLVADGERAMPALDTPAVDQFAEIADDAPALPPVLGDRYRPERELGHGGMARVYLARDLRHGRDVAVKVIREELAASLGRERFLREIAIAARLRHPNIVPLYDSGDANGLLYFVMPYEDGPSLRTRLAASGRLPISDALSILRDVARALQYAHAQGVVHRDIKPDNVMLSGGAAVVADFGIAKAVSAAQAETQGANLTQTGAGIGTPAYMAPEQAVGDPSSDHRADIYSYGCLAFELLTGQPPFQGRSTHQIIAAHVSTVPRALTEVREDVPVAVSQLVAQCLAKEPGDRPQSATELLSALDGETMTVSRPAMAVAATPVRSRVRLWSGGAAILALGATVAWWTRTPPPAITMAVLPFGNIGNDSAMTPVGAGLGDEVFTDLQRVPGLEMRSRSGARLYAGKLGVDEKEAGRTLGVAYLLAGEMREEGGRWRITTRLTQTSDASEIWNETYTVDLQQQLSVAGDIASGAAAALRRRFPTTLGQARELRPNQATTNPEAHRLNMLGQELLSRRGLSVKESAERFREAIRLDSTYAVASAGLSMALALSVQFEGKSPAEVEAELRASAERALRLDSTLAQPHVALGMAHQHRYQWDAARSEYREAIRLGPTDVEAHVQYGRHLLFMLRPAEALAQFQLARHEDPASPLVLGWTSYAFFMLGRRDSALAINAQAFQGNGLNWTAVNIGSRILLASGFPDSALALAARIGDKGDEYVKAATGDTHTRELIAAARRNGTPLRFDVALAIRDTAAALSGLERATDAHVPWHEGFPSTDPEFDLVRASPRFQALLKRVGLPLPSATVSRAPHAP